MQNDTLDNEDLPPPPPKLDMTYSLFEESPERLYSIWGVLEPVKNYLKRNTNIQRINIKEKYKPNKKDNIKIFSLNNFNLQVDSLISHASLIIHSYNNNKKYSIGFGSGKDNKLCIYSPDPVLITFLRNYSEPIDNVPLVYEQDGIDESSIEKLNTYLNANDTTVLFPARRPVLKVCYNYKDYKRILSRQQNGFNCWTALEDIFPDSTESINALYREMVEFNPRSLSSFFRGGQSKSKKFKKRKGKTKKVRKYNKKTKNSVVEHHQFIKNGMKLNMNYQS